MRFSTKLPVIAITEIKKGVPHGIAPEVDRTLPEPYGIDTRLEIFADEGLNVSAVFAIGDVCTEDVPDPAIRPRTAQSFSNQGQLALADKFIGAIHVTVPRGNVPPNVGELRFKPGIFHELGKE